MKLYTLLFEEHSIEDIEFSISEDTSLGENRKQVWVYANHPQLGNVASLNADSLNTTRPSGDEEIDAVLYGREAYYLLSPNAWNDFDKLRKQISNKPDEVTAWGINMSGSDRRFRGEGLGKAMYLHLLKYIATNYKGIVVNNQAWGGETSTLAKNVWKSLTKHPEIKHIGSAFWGGNISNIKLRARRLHGWEQREKYKQPRSAALRQALKDQD
jgi:hypothetical protein